MKPVRRLLRYASPYRGRIAVALCAMLVYAGASAGLSYLIKPIFDEVLPNRANLAWVAIAIIIVYMLKGVGNYVSTYLMTDVGQRVVRDLRTALFRHVMGQSAGFFARRTTGQLMSRIINDVHQVQQVVSETVADLLRESLSLVGYAGILFWFDARLALVCMTAAPLVVYPLVTLGRRVRATTRRSQEAIESLSHVAAEALTGHRIVKAFGSEDHEARKFRHASDRLYRTNVKVMGTMAILPPVMELLGGVAIAGALWYGSQKIAAGQLTTGDFSAFVAALFLMYGPAKRLSRVSASLQQARAAAERIFQMMDTHTEVQDRPGAVAMAPLERSIEFRGVSFGYADGGGHRILRDVSFTIGRAEAVAIVGLSGAGKTTLVNLIPRFYDVTGGQILVDGVDSRDVTLASLRSQIAMVTQETVLFDDTIAANISYGSPTATREEIEAAARAAHAHGFVLAMPEGYQTRIGERGQRLSGGQRQRIAIARALLKNAPILILDEATSSLDTESERLVQEALANLMKNRTAFIIAHRLSTVRQADTIIVLDRGRVVETGRHDELLARPDGVYAKLYALQIFDAQPNLMRGQRDEAAAQELEYPDGPVAAGRGRERSTR